MALVVAIVNATIAIALGSGRLLFSTARDGLWPGPFNRWFAAIHPRWRSPWIATLAIGGINALACALFDVTTLVTFGGALLVINYGLIAVAALASRWTQPDLVRPWRMPFFPFPPLVALIGLSFVLTQQRLADVAIVGALYSAGGLYYLLYLRRRRSARWELLEPAGSDE